MSNGALNYRNFKDPGEYILSIAFPPLYIVVRLVYIIIKDLICSNSALTVIVVDEANLSYISENNFATA